MKEPTVNFFTYVNEKYYYFVLPYLFSILKNTNHSVIIMVEDQVKFFQLYGKRLANLIYLLNGKNVNFVITDYGILGKQLQKIIPNTIRFLVEPNDIVWTKCNFDYTYITDCDMIITKEDSETAILHNIEGMERNETCFFNIKRPDRQSLSGIHFVKTKEYYECLESFLKDFKEDYPGEEFNKKLNSLSDEGFLYYFVDQQIGKPEELIDGNGRILPGIHLSPNRGKTYPAIKDALCKDPVWEQAFYQFDSDFIELMS